MILRHISEQLSRQNWPAVTIEMVVVVLGIFAALQADGWNEARKDRAEESLYLSELMEDFVANRENLSMNIGRNETILPAMLGLLGQSSMETPTWTVTQMNTAFKRIHDMPTFTAVRRAYSNLTGSGDLKLIRNRRLKNEIATYYAATALTEIVQNTHELELVETFQPYIIAEMDYQAVNPTRVEDFPLPPAVEEDRILEVLTSRTFRNVLSQKWTIISDLLDQFRGMQKRTETIIEMLQAEIVDPAS